MSMDNLMLQRPEPKLNDIMIAEKKIYTPEQKAELIRKFHEETGINGTLTGHEFEAKYGVHTSLIYRWRALERMNRLGNQAPPIPVSRPQQQSSPPTYGDDDYYEHKAKILEQYKQSGLSVSKFFVQFKPQISQGTLYAWIKKMKREPVRQSAEEQKHPYKLNIFDRYGMRLEDLGNGQLRGYCKWCDFILERDRRNLMNEMARHLRMRHSDKIETKGKPKKQQQRVEEPLVVRERVEIEAPVRPGQTPHYFEAFHCPNCGLNQDNISKAYQAVGLAQHFGYGNGKATSAAIRYCIRCGFDLLPGVKALQVTLHK